MIARLIPFPISRLVAGIVGFASTCVFSQVEETASTVRFANQDRLTGSIESLTPELLVWKSPLLEKPAPFLLQKVIDVTLPGTHHQSEADHEAVVSLVNGDTVRGQLASVTDEIVSIDTWFAGRLNFNRLMVSGLRIEGKSTFLYRGPGGLDGWIQSGKEPSWTYGRGAFRSIAAGSIARDGLLPDECAVTFELAKQSDSFAIKVILFSDEPEESNTDSGYEISFQRGSVFLRNCKTQAFLGSTHSQALMEYDKVRVEIRASRTAGKVCLLINERVIEVWSDQDVAKSKFGSSLHFVSQNTLPLRISGIGVASWDGVIDRMPEPRGGMLRQFGMGGFREPVKPATPPEKPNEGRMELANGDSIAGEVTSIDEGLITINSPLGEVKVPVARLRSVALKKVDLERAIRKQGDIRASFPDGSSIVFRLDSVGDGTLTGYSQNFGTATFKMAAFNRIEFNIYDPELEDKRGTSDW